MKTNRRGFFARVAAAAAGVLAVTKVKDKAEPKEFVPRPAQEKYLEHESVSYSGTSTGKTYIWAANMDSPPNYWVCSNGVMHGPHSMEEWA